MILLASGLPLSGANSFARQLRLLQQALGRLDRRALVLGVDTKLGSPRRLGETEWDLPCLDRAALSELLARTAREARGVGDAVEAVRALVLLGYPDQFALLGEEPPAMPVFLWAQASRPPRRESLGPALPVPLTELSRVHLERAGVPRIGPTIPHAVDTSLFRPASHAERRAARSAFAVDPSGFVVGTVGANTCRKRFDRLLCAFARFAARSRVDRPLLLIKTDRPVAAGGFDLAVLARRCGVADRVRVVDGELPAEALARLYAAMDVYVHAAEWEGFGIPVAEAMACGLPVVAAATQGPAEILPYTESLVCEGEWIEEAGTRLLLASAEALAAVLLRTAEDPSLRKRLGALGRERAATSYDSLVVAGRWLELIEGEWVPIRAQESTGGLGIAAGASSQTIRFRPPSLAW